MYGMVGGGGGASGTGSNKSNSRRNTQYRSSANAAAGASSGGVSRPSRSLYRRLLTFIKQAWTGVKFGSDTELDIIEQEPRYRPEDINALCRTTHFTRAELQRLYRSFKDRCPTGVVREDAFKELYFQMFPKGASSSKYPHYVFNNLDKESTGIINFEDMIKLLSRLSRGSLDDRLKWIFSLYDLNGDGCITRQEMTDVVQAVFDLMGKHTDTPVDEQTVGQKVETLFTTLDLNKDGVITLDEFTEACGRDGTIAYNIDAMLQGDIICLSSADPAPSDAASRDISR
ncbi:Kv channel-interacting protein 1-like [Portunus trituberculatus]|uniref:Kv channel-interacting protein 1-like n=1 Tax=Portunus trituberculatus TaxID=210409 RepID=UPI001E1CCB3E|nr:Kv channel-interacting protein 1-like [Portunus trituberculatus]XP_045137437.1 Kv channel-interacting protein 1-like [Portunus trituberculatus]